MARNSNQVIKRDSEILSNEETILLQDSEQAFFEAFGFRLPLKERQSVLSTKNELSLTIQDVSQLHKAGLLQCPAFEEPYLKLHKKDLVVAITETLLIPGVFLSMAFVIHGKVAAQGDISLTALLSIGALLLCGFGLFYYLFQQKIRPFYILRRTRLKFGQRFPAKREKDR